MAAHGGHLADLLDAGAYCFFARIEVAEAEVGAAAAALAVRLVAAVGHAAGPGGVFLIDDGAIFHVDEEVISLGNTVLPCADFLTGVSQLAMLAAEGAAAVDAEPDGACLACRELAEKSFFYLAA